jgi:arylsulfatase A-like enzyme
MPHVPLFVSDERYDPDPHKAYELTIEHIDGSVGQIMKTLEELDLTRDTFIVYTSDNGPWLSKKHHGGSALPLRAGKGTTYEGGMREPCVMRWPARIEPGQVCRQVASTIDLLPTFANIVGAELPAERPIDGLDITCLLDDPQAESPHDKAGYFYYKNNQVEAVRLGKWKLRLRGPELYDLRADIGESENLADQSPEVVQQLQDLAAAYDEDLKANRRPAWKK